MTQQIILDPQMRILVQGPNKSTADAILRLLKTNGLGNGKYEQQQIPALMACEVGEVQLLICDADGDFRTTWLFITALKTASNIPNIPVMITGKIGPAVSAAQLQEYGIHGFLKQPVDQREMMSLLTQTWAAHQNATSTEGQYSVAKQALIEQKTELAIESFNHLAGATNHSARSGIGLAQAHEQNHDHFAAQKAIDAVGESSDFSMLLTKLKLALSTENWEQAHTLTQNILNETKMHPVAVLQCIEALVSGKGYEIALKVIRTAEKKNTMQDSFHLLAAKSLYMTDKIDEAIAYLKVAESKEGRTLRTLEVRGRCHLRLQQFDLALDVYSDAIKLDSKNPQSYFNRALAHIALKQYPQAQTDLETSLKIAPSFVLATQKLREVKQLLLGSKAG